ncbi:MAG TPA: hypothetical protein VH643_31170 [Gemmataceae bacterium]
MAQGVNVEGAPAFIALGDAGELQVPVKDFHQPGRHLEDCHIGWQASGDRLAALKGFGLDTFQLESQPVPQVGRQIIAEGDFVAFAVLFVGSVKSGEGNRFIEMKLSHGQRSQFVLAESRQHQRFVDQGAFTSQQLQALPYFRADLGVTLALPLTLADSQGFEQRAAPGHVEQARQFGFIHRSPLPTPIGLFVGFRYSIKGIDGKPVRGDAPVAEGHDCISVGVAGAGGHALDRLVRKPALQGFAAQDRQRPERAIGGEPLQVAAGVLPMNPSDSLRL